MNHNIGKLLFLSSIQIVRSIVGVTKKSIEAHGINTNYLETENKSNKKDSIVFLHGFGDMKDTFLRSAISLRGEYNLIFPDIPGFSENEKNYDWEYTLENYARWLSLFLDALNLQKVHLVGNSLGGGMAAKLAIDHPDKVKSLCLISAAGVVPFNSRSCYHEIVDGNNIFNIEDYQQFESFLNNIFFAPPYIPRFIKEYIFEEHYRPYNDFYKKIVRDLNQGVRDLKVCEENSHILLNKKIEQIKCPTLIIWGDKDTLFSTEVAEIYHQGIQDSELHVFQEVGHAPQIEIPSKVGEKYKDFLTRRLL